jgi:hypothetical protein
MNDRRPPLRKYLSDADAANDTRLDQVHRRLRAKRDSFTSRWGLHLAMAAWLLGFLFWSQLKPAELAQKECVLIIRPSQPAQIIGDSC